MLQTWSIEVGVLRFEVVRLTETSGLARSKGSFVCHHLDERKDGVSAPKIRERCS